MFQVPPGGELNTPECHYQPQVDTQHTCPRKSVRGPEGTLDACACCACVRECACVCARTPYTDVCVSAHAYECAYSFLCVRVHARDDDALYCIFFFPFFTFLCVRVLQ